ncbi:coiled-coil domain-containing protein [Anabaenopsis elenkinii]|uniref:Uncharacterized protein n=1 Tax=Anabaenopsis elenkinii CCIBt3563 TaxID=2779889 RepID=A0A7S6RLE5_9CYAN|nr:hypothetical protein [Anabaenopsis elenkinii]QOV24417.1 hypothetical protein IM676_09430 [Anabaenopsis elenkinii CCIBt3563]
MTNDQNPIDLQVAKDLKKLTEVINNSVERANATLEQAQQLQKLTEVINNSVERANRTLEQAQEVDQQVRNSCDQLIESERKAREIGDQLSQKLQAGQIIETNIQQLEAKLSQNLEAAESFSNLLDELTQAKRELEEIGVTSLVEQARLILEDVNNVRAESHKILLTTQNYLEQSQQIKEDNLAISTANATRINESISQIDTYNQNIEAQVSQNLENLQSFSNILRELTQARRELEEIGVSSLVEQAILILEDVNNVRAESQRMLLTTQNYLEQSQQIKEDNLAISTANATSINESISQIDRYYQNIEVQLSQKLHELQTLDTNIRQLGDQVSQNLEYLQGFTNILHELREAKRELEEIAVTSLVEQARLILEDANNVRAESKKIMQENQAIYAAIDRYNENIDNARSIVTQLDSIKSEIDGIGGLEEVRNLLQQVDNARVDLRNSNHQLSLLQGEISQIQYLENYLQDFGRVRNHKQLRQFLRQELGFIGLIVYVLHLLTRNRKR